MNDQNTITDVCCDIQGVVEIMKLLSDALLKDASRYCCIPGIVIDALERACDKLDEIDMTARKEDAA